jgi:hypothetical protein
VWRHDGKELFYLNPAGELMAAPITTTATAVVPGVPLALVPTRVVGGGIDAIQARQYDVADHHHPALESRGEAVARVPSSARQGRAVATDSAI